MSPSSTAYLEATALLCDDSASYFLGRLPTSGGPTDRGESPFRERLRHLL